jgi:hypothetical protein
MQTHSNWRKAILSALISVCAVLASNLAHAWQMDGVKTVVAHTRDKQQIAIGTVTFTPQPDGMTAFKLDMNQSKFTDYFLSMKEFKCLASVIEVTCHVPYPYRHPGKVTTSDFAWLEHNLLFLFKRPAEFGAKLWNGVYFKFKLTDIGLVGEPMAIDLNRISAPPDDLNTPSYGPDARDTIPAGTRWVDSITIE